MISKNDSGLAKTWRKIVSKNDSTRLVKTRSKIISKNDSGLAKTKASNLCLLRHTLIDKQFDPQLAYGYILPKLKP